MDGQAPTAEDAFKALATVTNDDSAPEDYTAAVAIVFGFIRQTAIDGEDRLAQERMNDEHPIGWTNEYQLSYLEDGDEAALYPSREHDTQIPVFLRPPIGRDSYARGSAETVRVIRTMCDGLDGNQIRSSLDGWLRGIESYDRREI